MRQPGSTLGPYVVESLLAEGGMGAVYRAKNRVTGQLRAIKVVRPELVEKRDFVDRFVREATIASQLRHPNLVETLEPGIDGTVIYLPMELLEGETLSVHLKRKKRLTPAEAAEILVPVTQAVQLLHDKGVVHRDLKPMNIFITRGPGGAIVPKVIDLGTARDVDGEDEHTRTGMVVGSPFYMAPEQAEGRRDIDGRADQYALGVIAYQMITGARPYESDDTRSALAKLLRGEPYVPPSRYFPGLHPSVEAVIVRALARERERRFARIDELGRALTDAAAGLPVPSAALPPPAILPPGVHEVPTAPPGLAHGGGPAALSSTPPPGGPATASPLGTPGPFAPPPDGTPAPAARSRTPLMVGAVLVLALLGAGAAALTWSMSPTMTATPLAPRAPTAVGAGPAPMMPPITITTTPVPTPTVAGSAGATPEFAGVAAGAAGTTATGTSATTTAAGATGSSGAAGATPASGASTGAAGAATGGAAEAGASGAGAAAATTDTSGSRGAAGTATDATASGAGAPATTDTAGSRGATPAATGTTAGTPSTSTGGSSASGTRTTPSTTGSSGSGSGTSGERTGGSATTAPSGSSNGSSGGASSGSGSSRGSSGGTRHDEDDEDDHEHGGTGSHGAPCGAATGIPCLE